MRAGTAGVCGGSLSGGRRGRQNWPRRLHSRWLRDSRRGDSRTAVSWSAGRPVRAVTSRPTTSRLVGRRSNHSHQRSNVHRPAHTTAHSRAADGDPQRPGRRRGGKGALSRAGNRRHCRGSHRALSGDASPRVPAAGACAHWCAVAPRDRVRRRAGRDEPDLLHGARAHPARAGGDAGVHGPTGARGGRLAPRAGPDVGSRWQRWASLSSRHGAAPGR
jgi:hypothetical protein